MCFIKHLSTQANSFVHQNSTQRLSWQLHSQGKKGHAVPWDTGTNLWGRFGSKWVGASAPGAALLQEPVLSKGVAHVGRQQRTSLQEKLPQVLENGSHGGTKNGSKEHAEMKD